MDALKSFISGSFQESFDKIFMENIKNCKKKNKRLGLLLIFFLIEISFYFNEKLSSYPLTK